jgi:hypothetical protein
VGQLEQRNRELREQCDALAREQSRLAELELAFDRGAGSAEPIHAQRRVIATRAAEVQELRESVARLEAAAQTAEAIARRQAHERARRDVLAAYQAIADRRGPAIEAAAETLLAELRGYYRDLKAQAHPRYSEALRTAGEPSDWLTRANLAHLTRPILHGHSMRLAVEYLAAQLLKIAGSTAQPPPTPNADMNQPTAASVLRWDLHQLAHHLALSPDAGEATPTDEATEAPTRARKRAASAADDLAS